MAEFKINGVTIGVVEDPFMPKDMAVLVRSDMYKRFPDFGPIVLDAKFEVTAPFDITKFAVSMPRILTLHDSYVRREQFRFPRSKCKRIRKKWAARSSSYRDVKTTTSIDIPFRAEDLIEGRINALVEEQHISIVRALCSRESLPRSKRWDP